MADTEVIGVLEAQILYMQALLEIINDSSDPDAIRLALSALTSTPNGIEFLRMHPITL